jgi:release factor glutamine methyltransferase
MLALAGGIDVYERLFAQAAEVLRPGGAVVVEIGASQASRIGVAAADAGFGSVEVETDLTGRDRIVTARKPT